MDLKEKRFEDDIESYLLNEGGYVKGSLATYDAARAIDMSTLVAFVKSSQPKIWDRYTLKYPVDTEKQLYKTLSDQVSTSGLIHVLRKGIDDRGIKIHVAFFRPETGMNEEVIKRYDTNILTCTRQFAYSPYSHNTIDMVLSLNGIPIIALELKNQLTCQSVDDGKRQWMYDRDPKELIFNFNRRILAYFTADLYDVYMSTKLEGKNTVFLPFNQGSGGAGKVGGAGNPTNPDDFSTSYLWEHVLNKDALLGIVQRYIHLEKSEKRVIKNGEEKIERKQNIIFPRYHQFDVVTKVIADVKKVGSGKNYLIQHSAGSGKSNSIAWLAYRLSSIHNENDESIFRSVIVVTDRRILNGQLQNTILSIDHTPGLVVAIDNKNKSTDLRDAINDGKKIIITTLQRFPIIYEQLDKNAGKNFALIVDEAHSSQTGASARKLKAGLADTAEALEEYIKIENEEESKAEDLEDKLVKEMSTHGNHKNLSFFAFTATPKAKTIEMFGEKHEDGMFYPFHIYSMRQAIEEGFILDVLKNYVTYKTFFKIIKTTPDNPALPESPAKKAVRRYQSFHATVLRKKTEVIVEQFREITQKKIGGKAKAMVVTPSRLHAVKYYQEFKNYIKEKGYSDLDVLVAFSGTVTDKGGIEYTEPGLNKTKDGKSISEEQLKAVFREDDFGMLIVAEKYQTGYDEPLLHTMFVDKKLDGIKAVQTLSRVNRIHPLKSDTFILDFVNEADDIKEAFKPYYESTMLEKEVEVNLIYQYKNTIENYHLWNNDDVKKFSGIYYKVEAQTAKDMGKISSILKPVIDRYNSATEEAKYEFKNNLRAFNNLYSYIVQMTRLFDKDLHKLYMFTNYLSKIIPYKTGGAIDLDDQLKLQYNQIKETYNGAIELDVKPDDGVLKPQGDGAIKPLDNKTELLEEVIRKINEAYKGNFTDGDRIMVEALFSKFSSSSKKLKKYAKNNDAEVFTQAIFPAEFSKMAQACYAESMDAFAKLLENKEFYNEVMENMGKEIYKSLRSEPNKPKTTDEFKFTELVKDLPIAAEHGEAFIVETPDK